MLPIASFPLFLDYSTYATGNYKWPGSGSAVPTEKLSYPQGECRNHFSFMHCIGSCYMTAILSSNVSCLKFILFNCFFLPNSPYQLMDS